MLLACFAPSSAAEGALRSAAARGDAAAVEAALSRGADADCRAPDGDTPLHSAVLCDSTAAAAALLRAGASVHTRNAHGQTPLHLAACREGAAPMVQLLLKSNADPRARSTVDGRTALHNAAEYGDEPCARALLAAGAVIDARTLGGATPAQLALNRASKHSEAILGLFAFWAADLEAAAAARLLSSGPGARVLGCNGSFSGRFSLGGSASGRNASGRHGGASSRGGGGGASNRGGAMLKQHGSCAALMVLQGADVAAAEAVL